MSQTLQRASSRDAELAYEIKGQAHAPYTIEGYGHWAESFQRSFTLRNPRFTRLIVVDGPVIGWIAADDEAAGADISAVHVVPAHQRKGRGREALDLVLR
jgi:GNAT superfamily N-acetyltransferase